MANTKSAAKRARQTETRTAHNAGVLSGLKTSQKKFRKLAAEGNTEAAQSAYKTVVSELDRAAKRGVIHKNAADRRKSKFARAMKPAPASA